MTNIFVHVDDALTHCATLFGNKSGKREKNIGRGVVKSFI